MYWEVDIGADSDVLTVLEECFSNAEVSIVRSDDGSHVLRSSDFMESMTAGDVKNRADEIATWLVGALSLRGSSATVKAGAVYRVRDDGTRDTNIPVAAAVSISQALPLKVTVGRGDGGMERQNDPAVGWVHAAAGNPNAAKVLRLLSSGNANWPDLYRIFEVIQDSACEDLTNWVSNAQIRRFKRSANSVAAAGDQARHGAERTRPPNNPMSIGEAREFVRQAARKWLDSLGAGAAGERSRGV